MIASWLHGEERKDEEETHIQRIHSRKVGLEVKFVGLVFAEPASIFSVVSNLIFNL